MAKQRIVVKVGTHVLTKSTGELDKPIFRQLVVQLVKLVELGWQPVLVSSGAVGAGKSIIGELAIEDEAVRRQVWSSIGQASLMKRYFELFQEYDLICAQVLATKDDFSEGEHYQNMLNCFEGLLAQGIIPIVNENDVVSLTELMFTDNDELAGLTAKMIKANKLLILSNIDGFYTGLPEDEASELISEVPFDTDQFDGYVQSSKSSNGRGGMASKYKVVKGVAAQGIEAHIANGKLENVMVAIATGEDIGTKFLAK